MLDQNLVTYIKVSLSEGKSHELIKQSLLANGWQEAMIDEAFNFQATQSTDSVHVAASNVPSTKPLLFYRPATNSPFSVLLALVLTGTLFILTNRIVTDISNHFDESITSNLIVNGFIVLPFLLLAFLLHTSFGFDNKRYLILSRPYYIIAAWLLIRLLFKVSKYLLDANSAYGVYIVLGLIVGVLTVMVIFIQHYLKKD